MGKCFICLQDAKISDLLGDPPFYNVECKICGNYKIADEYIDFEKYAERYIFSGIVRNLHEQGEKVDISTRSIKNLFDSISIPSDPLERIDLLLKHIYRKENSNSVAAVVKFNASDDYSLLFAKSPFDFKFCLDKARELGYIESIHGKPGDRLSIDGWRRFIELQKSEIKSNQAFVAMWFDPSLDDVLEKGFKLALKETGYDPIRIDLVEHNEKICDRIIADIRKSGLVVADFTGQRGGVYFEAGFAMGLGIPVIWTCRDTDEENLHFDTRQYNHIFWSNPEDLKKKLINRIEATLPNRP